MSKVVKKFNLKSKIVCFNGHKIAVVGRTKQGCCRKCRKLIMQKYYKKYRYKIIQYSRKYYTMHKIKIQKRMKKYQEFHREEIRKYLKSIRIKLRMGLKIWRKNNPKKMREYARRSRKLLNKLYKTNMQVRLASTLRTRIRGALKRYFNRKKVKQGSAVKDLGCSMAFFVNYIEKKFYGKISWDNYGKVWQLDHIQELHTFNLTDKKQFLRAIHYTNLQPLTIPDHIKKSNKQRALTKLK